MDYEGKSVVILEFRVPLADDVQFQGIEVHSCRLVPAEAKDHQQIEQKLWRVFDTTYFEELPARRT